MPNFHRRLLIGIVLLAVILRVAAALYLGDHIEVLPGTSDQISYHTLALRVMEGHGFSFGEYWWPATSANAPTAHWSYLYVGYLIGVYALFGPHPLAARVIQAIIVGILQTYLTFLIGEYLFNRKVGMAASAIVAVYAYFIYYSATLMTESFYITAILASLYLLMVLLRRGESDRANRGAQIYIVLGLALGSAVLLRQLFLLFIPFIFLWLWWFGRKIWVRTLLFTTAILIILILPFTIYNFIRFNRFVLLNTNAGFAFFWGNHPIYGTHFEPILPYKWGSYQDLIPTELRSLDEAALDQALLIRGIQFVIDNPLRYVLLSLSRIPPYFEFWPSSDSGLISNITRLVSFALFLPFMLWGLWLSFTKYKDRDSNYLHASVLLLCLFVFVYTLIHVLTWTLIRYRLPIDAVMIIFAGLAVVDIIERVPVFQKIIDRSVAHSFF